MRFLSLLRVLVSSAVACVILSPTNVQAGPFLDWLFGRNRSAAAYPVGSPVPIGNGAHTTAYGAAVAAGNPGYAANYGTYYGPQQPVVGPAGAGYTAGRPTGIAGTIQPPTISYVPNYRSSGYRAPVTYYRPIMTTDPNTGAQVVTMTPCTSYEIQTQRSPALGRSALFGSGQLPPVVPPARRSRPTHFPAGAYRWGLRVRPPSLPIQQETQVTRSYCHNHPVIIPRNLQRRHPTRDLHPAADASEASQTRMPSPRLRCHQAW